VFVGFIAISVVLSVLDGWICCGTAFLGATRGLAGRGSSLFLSSAPVPLGRRSTLVLEWLAVPVPSEARRRCRGKALRLLMPRLLDGLDLVGNIFAAEVEVRLEGRVRHMPLEKHMQ
jgi:hypothetical protein